MSRPSFLLHLLAETRYPVLKILPVHSVHSASRIFTRTCRIRRLPVPRAPSRFCLLMLNTCDAFGPSTSIWMFQTGCQHCGSSLTVVNMLCYCGPSLAHLVPLASNSTYTLSRRAFTLITDTVTGSLGATATHPLRLTTRQD